MEERAYYPEERYYDERVHSRQPRQRIGYTYEPDYDDYYEPEPRAYMRGSSRKSQAKVHSMMKQPVEDTMDMTEEGEQFLKILQDVFEETPETWKQYPDTQDGRLGIMDMEFKEFKQALSKNKDKNEICKELMHVVGACFYMYKELTDE